ncbi:outer membrane receptor protein involved in Fe transport [Pseudomonas nitritireducens]|uniref:Outer membrane receptor protein involved in Fe transport n=1 Tax=Pseudomonas nitroreducens TaxID=46680 RepID=A0A7W7P3M4_PSENT|nr:TonB-dependent receptor [Pseudomonas nitritireducens]MBB4865745.1 outer membrane receptor protein involved in Fe transport [Pseudomonas nitritireducens]
MPGCPLFRSSALALFISQTVVWVPMAGAAEQDPPLALEDSEVIGALPLPSLGLARDRIAAPVQTFDADEIARSQSLGLADFLDRRAAGVYVNDIQNNPLQPDINYRGFTASPLLGTPQGLSLYLDGVRMNQPFGDVVSWDLIPDNAIASAQLMPGSNPLFGLNTLGGALAVQTKNGRDNPGGAIQTTLGSYGRRIGEVEYGGSEGQWDWFAAGTHFEEDGWREHSDSDAQKLFGKLGWRGESTDLKLTYSFADTDLNGNGMVPRSFLRRDYDSVYTYPDNTQNTANFLNLQWSHDYSDDLGLSGNLYYRHIGTDTFNGDINDEALPEEIGGPGQNILTAPGAYTTAGNLQACRAQFEPGGEPGEKCSGMINRTRTRQSNIGLFQQLSVRNRLLGLDNQFALGGGFDFSQVRFQQSAEYGALTADRGIVGTGVYAEADNAFNLDGELDDRAVRLKGNTRTWSLYGSDTLTLHEGLDLTLSGRYNDISVRNHDQQTHYELDGDSLGEDIDESASLSGKHHFNRFNPAIGLTFQATPNLTAYAGYSEGSRAPTTIELGCANPDAPCRLPNSMAGDPPLEQVVTRTFEAGLRGRIGDHLGWNAGLFSSRNSNDIQFVSSSTSGSGYFANFGETRRRGVETGLFADLGDWSLGANYTFIDATYRSAETFLGEANSSAEDGRISVRSGDRIPLIPRHILKLSADYAASERLSLGADAIGISSSYVRGNENNDHQSGGLYEGSGEIGGYTVFNLSAAYQVDKAWKVFAEVDNLFDREYLTAGMLGANPFDASGVMRTDGAAGNGTVNGRRSNTVGETFVSPGAPRTAWMGVRWQFL